MESSVSVEVDAGRYALDRFSKILISNARKLLTVDTEDDIMARASMLKEAQLRGSREGPIERTVSERRSGET
jgi:hypothetical protein